MVNRKPETPVEATQVLNAAQHRGARSWCVDPATARVHPEAWNELTQTERPELTPFEAIAVARSLVEIGAARPAPAKPGLTRMQPGAAGVRLRTDRPGGRKGRGDRPVI